MIKKSALKSWGYGFTLVELLIVVTIIAILTVIGIVNYSSFTRSSRDAKRQSDLKMIQSALEAYHADQIYYPYSDSVISGSPLTNATGGTSVIVPKTYLTTVPSDPTVTVPYSYKAYKLDGTDCPTASVGSCTKYCLFAQMEDRVPRSDTGCTPVLPRNYGVTRP